MCHRIKVYGGGGKLTLRLWHSWAAHHHIPNPNPHSYLVDTCGIFHNCVQAQSLLDALKPMDRSHTNHSSLVEHSSQNEHKILSRQVPRRVLKSAKIYMRYSHDKCRAERGHFLPLIFPPSQSASPPSHLLTVSIRTPSAIVASGERLASAELRKSFSRWLAICYRFDALLQPRYPAHSFASLRHLTLAA